MTPKIDLIIQILKSEPGRSMKTTELAFELFARFPQEFKSKTDNPRFKDKKDIIKQIAAEIAGHKQEQFDKRNSGILINNDKPRTFVYPAKTTNTSVSHPSSSVSHKSKEPEYREPSSDNDNNDWDGKEERKPVSYFQQVPSRTPQTLPHED